MTREEREKVIDLLDNLIGVMEDNQGNDYDFALKKGIEALKQEDVIDKIKAEIEQNVYPIIHGCNDHELGMTLYGILQVLDKYKAEGEE